MGGEGQHASPRSPRGHQAALFCFPSLSAAPPSCSSPPHSIKSASGAGLLIYERAYALKGSPVFLHGAVEASPMLPTAPEVFVLRKLLPMTTEYDFNVHVMDFNPGEYLQVKVGRRCSVSGAWSNVPLGVS